MKKLSFLWVAFIFVFACGNSPKDNQPSIVAITTDFGVIKVRLYDETVEHKGNFLKLVNEGFYNELLFHRVIKNFMIQGGDPDSRNAEQGKRLGGGSPDYTLPAEFMAEKYFHKKGALAAARTGGPSNPEKRSSGSQFYIVQGQVFTAGKLDTLEMMKNTRLRNEMMKQRYDAIQEEMNLYRQNNDQTGFNLRIAQLRTEVDSIFASEGLDFRFTDEQRNTYTTEGGYPSLDGDYTVFGEVIEGLEVLDKIAAVETDENDRPLKDMRMKLEIVK